VSTTEIDRQWTTKLRRRVTAKLPPEKLSRHPARLRVLVDLRLWRDHALRLDGRHRDGLSAGDPWTAVWHGSGIGHFVNSMHLWSVEIFFFAMVIHLWGSTSWPRGAADGHSRG